MIYGPRTTSYVLEEDVINLNPTKYRVDTSLNDLHNIPFLYGRNAFFQDLGVIGTPVNPYGYFLPERPGRRYGYHIYDIYAIEPNQIKYYDTRSPFSEIKYVQGSRGQQAADIGFSRNINYHWNIGIDYRRVASKKIIGLVRRETQATINAFDIYTRYFSGNSKRYEVLASMSYFDAIQNETGGIFPSEEDSIGSLFDDIRERVHLNLNTRSHEKRFNYRIYQHLNLVGGESLQLYNIFNYNRRFNWFKDANDLRFPTQNQAYYDSLNITVPGRYYAFSTFNSTGFNAKEDEAGLKGKVGNFFYKGYYRYRNLQYYQGYEDTLLRFNENFVGGAIRFTFNDSISYVSAEAEKMLGPDYNLKLQYNGKVFFAGAQSIAFSPSLFQIRYAGNFLQWSDTVNLVPTVTNRIFAGLKVEKERYFARIKGNYHNINNHIYLDTNAYRQQARPEQTINIASADIDLGVRISKLHFENYARLFSVSGADSLIRLPEIINRFRFYYQNYLLKAAFFQIGFDINFRSAYRADKYLPFHQHYYLNNDFPDDANLSAMEILYVDLFLNAQIKNVVAFVKLVHANQGYPRDGYFITPGYTGLPRTVLFGVNWKFYN